MPTQPRFCLETLVDFPDDALTCGFPLTPAHVDALMARLAALGVRRVIWADYGDGHGGYLMPSGIARRATTALSFDQNQWHSYARTLDGLGNPLRVATEAAHRHGLKIYAYYKPYETGISWLLPAGSPEGREWGRLPQLGGYLTWVDPFVLAHPELRIKRRTDDLDPAVIAAPIHTIRLTKKDAAPTRIRKENLQIWTSDLNCRYVRREMPFAFAETVEPSPVEVRDIYGNLLTAPGAPVRVLTLAGLALTDPYFVVTTDFSDGPGDFANAWDRLLRVFDAQGREIPGVYATGTAIWLPEWENFRTGGLAFDTGRGPEATTLDLPNGGGDQLARSGNRELQLPGLAQCQGIVGFARGRNAHLPGGLCETEPAVQEYWLRCVGEILAAGVDGIEVRVENHSCHTDTPDDYGYNEAVLARVPPGSPDLPAAVARVRGDAYTEFLRRAKKLIAAAGKALRVNLNVDWFRPAAERPRSRRLAYPANIDFDWRRWVAEGLLDTAMLRPFATPFAGIFGEDAAAREMLTACGEQQIPVSANRYVWSNPGLLDEFRRVRADPRFSGFVLYETWSYLWFTPEGGCDLAHQLAGRAGQPDDATSRAKIETSQHVEEVCSWWRKQV
ncbi:hypothetical protein HQ590_04330 [bacterium]|nr:hypothetical protein [bacterium]